MSTNGILIVVPCLNESLHIERVLRQFLQNDLPDRCLVVAVDGGSTDGTVDIIGRLCQEFGTLRLLHNRAKLQSAGINLAVEAYGKEFDYLLRVDAHADYPGDYLERLYKEIVTKDAQSVVVPLVSQGDTWFQKAVAIAQNSLLGTGGSPHRHKGRKLWVDHGHHALFSMAWFRKIGGYNADFAYNEDAEFDVRLVRAGGKIWLDGDAPVIYYPRRNIVTLCTQYYAYGGGRAQTVRLHKTPLKLRQMAPIVIAPMCLVGMAGLVVPGLWPLAIPMGMWAMAAQGFGIYLTAKYKDWRGLVSGTAAMAMHVSWSAGYWREFLVPRRKKPTQAGPRDSKLEGMRATPKSPESRTVLPKVSALEVLDKPGSR